MSYNPMCSFCQEYFNSKNDLHRHLVGPDHQLRGKSKRDDFKNWTETLKESCVVVLDDVSPLSLLEFVSQRRRQIENYFDSTLESAAKIIQLKSDRMVSQLFFEVEQAPNILIEGKKIRLIRAVDFHDDDSQDQKASKREVEYDNFLETPLGERPSSLWCEFTEIYSEVLSPVTDFTSHFDILERTREIVERLHTSAKLSVFRHWYMDELIIYALLPNLFPSSSIAAHVGRRRLIARLQKGGIELTNFDVENANMTLLDNQTGIKFSFVYNPIQKQDMVIQELQKLLLTFDPRGKAMLTMLLYWVRQHGLKLSFKQCVGMEEFLDIPKVLGLQWLCIFYLCQQGYVPTPRDVINRVGEESVETVEMIRRSGARMWFPMDYGFVREWRSKMNMPKLGTHGFVLFVLKMLLGFLEFCDSVDFTKLALNPIDVELLARNEVVKGSGLHDDGNMLNSCFLICEEMFEPLFIKNMQLKLSNYLKQ
ncbi:unnamed protein product [Orchesella dallaii]|uniref:C2H2-type domain-containing protein n=1 Tax=Orchesella dallaii TaxID=48710 RepID=A0ABP1QJI3_9HEXA